MTRAFPPRGRPPAPRPLLGSLFSLALLALSACGPGDDPALPETTFDVERYDLVAQFDWDRDRLVATAGITVDIAEPGDGLLTLDSAVTSIASVRTAEGEPLSFEADVAARTLTIDVSSIARPGVPAKLKLVIDYEASPGDALSAVRERPGDPVPVRALFTDSEPLDAAAWMPCNNRPDDRALFSVDMTMAPGERMIANGDLVLEEGGGGAPRRMKYETQYPLPTYLMAFAVSEFEVEEGQAGDLPISIWHRPGVAGDYPGTLAELSRLITLYEPLLGPYPFEKYALVLVPNFGGGMENASITFQSEVSGAEPALSMSLIAHELGHQWWGDAVTVATWDDVWIKEGIAVLLENEAARAFDDKDGRGALFGERYAISGGEAARDVSLPPIEKYTSGPYDRAAWIFTQVRHEVGEDTFWGTLRDLLESNRFGTISTDALIAAFEPHLAAPAAERLRAAVDARDLPYLDVQTQSPGNVRVTLHDPGGVLIAPIEIEWHHQDGTAERTQIEPEQPLSLTRKAASDFLVVDPDDVHPSLWRLLADDASWDAYWAELAPLQVPVSTGVLPVFYEIPGVLQASALLEGELPPITPAQLPAFSQSLDSDTARATALARACKRAAEETDPAVQEAWTGVLSAALQEDPPYRGLPFAARLAACSDVLDPLALFPAEWDALAAGHVEPGLSVERVHYLSTFDLPFQQGLDTWAAPAALSHSLRARTIAARYVRLRSVAAAQQGAEVALWRATVLALLEDTRASEVLRQLLPAASSFTDAPAADKQALQEILIDVVRSPDTRPAHVTAVCAAHWLNEGDAGGWSAFRSAAEDAPLAAQARPYLDDPARCD